MESKGLWKENKASFKKVICMKPDDTEAYKHVAVAFGRMGWLDTKIISCQKAVKINPNHAAANYDYGLALTNIKDFEKAKEHALKALELTPSGPDRERYLQGGLWLIHIGLKDFDEAIKSMEYMLEKNPGFTGAYGFMASLHALKGNIDIAKGHLAKYQELRPKVKTLKDYEKVAPTIVKEIIMDGLEKAGMPKE